jgi:hypothetical protein
VVLKNDAASNSKNILSLNETGSKLTLEDVILNWFKIYFIYIYIHKKQIEFSIKLVAI